LIGDKDLRVPPHQAYFYQAALMQKGVETRLYNYPGSGHALLPVEHGYDASFNISTWMDRFLMEPFERAYVPPTAAAAAEESKAE